MRRVRMGVIGVGALGQHHARLYGECEGVDVVGVFDRDAARAAEIAGQVGTRAFASVEALAAEVDGLSVAVPTDLHYAVVKDLLERGRHVLVEKPITEKVAQAEALVAQAAQRGLVLQVGHVERYNPILSCLGEIPGEPRFIEAHRLAPYPPPRPGLRPRGTEVSVVLDLMIHDIDVVLSLVGCGVARAEGVGVPVLSRTEDIANARLVFANGCVANLTASRVSAERMRKIRVFKSRAYLSLDYQERKGEIAYLKDGGIVRQEVPAREGNALKEEIADFCVCVRGCLDGQGVPEPRVSGQQGLEALRVADRIMQSIAAGALVQ